MNRRIIKRMLDKKHKDYCESITDPAVKKLVQKNSIITGGSIVSMLLGEPVNDYDYYFQDKDTVIAVANYYVAEFIKAHPDCSIKPEVVIKEDRVSVLIQSAGIASEGESDQEYQYFEQRSEGEGEDYANDLTQAVADGDNMPAEELEKGNNPYHPVFISANAITLSDKVQLVMRFYGDPKEIHKNYDFVHCTNYWTSDDGKLVLRQPALESILAKQLHYTGSLYPVCSVIRTRKFIKQGWHINAGQFLKMCFQISELNLQDIGVLEEQLTGVDAAYFIEVIEYCKSRMEKEKDFKITMPYLVSIIDKIF